MTDIMSLFPGEPRAGQEQILRTCAADWDRYNVFGIVGPVALGKSKVAITLAKYAAAQGLRAAVITHNNIQVEQYVDGHPDFPVLHKRERYPGDKAFYTARAYADKADTVLSNYFTYVANKLHRDVLIIDEAHNVISMLQERWAKKLWQSQWHWPDELATVDDFVQWAESMRSDELAELVQDIVVDGTYTLQRTEELLRGKPTPVLKLIPLNVRHKHPWLWPRGVRKIFLLSATISPLEVHELGLDNRRVTYIEADSPIPAANRPVFVKPVANMAYVGRQQAVELLAKQLHRDLECRRGKGMIHATYDVAARLRGLLAHSRLVWHTNADKQRQYQQWRDSPPGQQKVLVASGMTEGVDLAYDAARWQVITQVPYPSLADPAVRHKAAAQVEWFRWQAVKAVLQTIGRVCRAPDDYGETWIYDSQFSRLLRETTGMWPQHVLNSIRETSPGVSRIVSNMLPINIQ